MSADFSRADCLTTIGVMSGTSLDGADAVAVRFERSTARALRMTRLGHAFLPMPDALRSELLSLALGRGADEIERMGTASVALANLYAEVVEKLLSENGIDRGTVAAIGVHGQTIRHRPEKGFTLQLNHPALVAERCGIDVVADFRSRDVAAGGEGAPLVPAFHAQAFAGDEPTAVLEALARLAAAPAVWVASDQSWIPVDVVTEEAVVQQRGVLRALELVVRPQNSVSWN